MAGISEHRLSGLDVADVNGNRSSTMTPIDQRIHVIHVDLTVHQRRTDRRKRLVVVLQLNAHDIVFEEREAGHLEDFSCSFELVDHHAGDSHFDGVDHAESHNSHVVLFEPPQ